MRRLSLLLFATLCLPITASVESQERLMALATGPFQISIGNLSAVPKKAGLTEQWLENAIELGLRRNKIPLPGDWQSSECRAVLDAIPPGETRTVEECAMPLSVFMESLAGPRLHMALFVLDIHVGSRSVGYTYYADMTVAKLVPVHPETQPIPNEVRMEFIELWQNGRLGITGNADELRGELRKFISEQTDALGLEYLRHAHARESS